MMDPQQEKPLWKVHMVPRGALATVRKQWHLLATSSAVLITLVPVILGIAQNVEGFKAYDAWVMITWITCNIVMLMAILLLNLRYLLRTIQTGKGEEAIILVVVLVIYFFGGLAASGGEQAAFVFAVLNLVVAFVMLVYDIFLTYACHAYYT